MDWEGEKRESRATFADIKRFSNGTLVYAGFYVLYLCVYAIEAIVKILWKNYLPISCCV